MKGLKLLLWKNFRVQSRYRLATAVELLLPVISLLFFGWLHTVMKVKDDPNPLIHKSFRPHEIPKVVWEETSVIYYGPSNNLTDAIMEIVHKRFFRNRRMKYTFRKTSNMQDLMAQYNLEREMWNENLLRGPILGAVYFDNLKWGIIPEEIKYTIKMPSAHRTPYALFSDRGGLADCWQNENNYPLFRTSGPRAKNNREGGFPGYFDEGFLYLQFAVDSAIIQLLGNQKNTEHHEEFHFHLQRFPFPPSREDKFDFTISIWCPFFLGSLFAFPVMNLTRKIIQEKSSRLKEFLKIMGLKSWLHWTAWFIQSYSFYLITALLMTVAAKVRFNGELALLTHSDPFLIFATFAAYCFTAVGFSFLTSTLFESAEVGSTATGFAWILLVQPSLKFTSGFEEYSNLIRFLHCALGGSVPMNLCWFYMATFEKQGTGLQWENLWRGVTSKDEMSVGVLIIIMFAGGIFNMFAAVYVELAFPGQFGIRLPWYFPFTKWFWSGSGCPNDPQVAVKAGTMPKENFEHDPVHLPVGVEFKGLTKVFKTKAAVNNLNFKMYQNQVTALLGHNGAGKTTTMSMLIGLIRPTSGTALINGLEIQAEMHKIRSSIGLCPQNNILFDSLTVEEHLKFYCTLKGMNKAEVMEETDRCLGLLGLEGDRKTLSRRLSAGVKRKLCVGMAFSAGSKVVLLDEPTAGMDPCGRRSTWDIIQSERRGRVVILSTHYMEEADILGDRIAIMANGQLQACGSSIFLKQRYGRGFNLTIVKNSHSNVSNIKEIVLKSAPTSVFTQDVGQEIKFQLPSKPCVSLCPLLEDLETNKDELGIIAFGLNASTLEEVFVRIGEEVDGRLKKEPVRLLDLPTENGHFHHFVESTRALNYPERGRNDGISLWLQQLDALIIKRTLMNVRRRTLFVLQLVLPLLGSFIVLWNAHNVPAMRPPPRRDVSVKHFEDTTNPKMILSCGPGVTLCTSVRHMYKNVIEFEDVSDSIPLVSLILEKTQESEWKMESDYLFAMESHRELVGNGKNVTQVYMYFNNQQYHLPPAAASILSNLLLKHLGANHTISVTSHPFDPSHVEEALTLQGMDGAFFVSLALLVAVSFLSAAVVVLPAEEEISKAKQLQMMAGVSSFWFWLAEFIVNIGVYTAVITVVLLSTSLMIPKELTEFELQLRLLLISMVCGFAVIPFGLLASTFANSPAESYARLLMLYLTTPCFSLLLNVILRSPDFELQDYADPYDNAMMIVPTYALARAASNTITNYRVYEACHGINKTAVCESFPYSVCCTGCKGKIQIQENYFAWDGLGVSKQLAYMLAFSLISFLLLVLRESEVIPKSKLLFRRLLCPKDPSLKRFDSAMEMNDPDVNRECRRINNASLATLALLNPLVLRNVKKSYNGQSVLNGLCFGVEKGEIFGLLGGNGCGKTTIFKILTGDVAASSGDAFISSYSVLRQRRKARRHLGYCPQTDALIPELTGRETLTLFARLKGIKERNIGGLVQDVASKLLFTKFLDKPAGEYSGGNKRKLSVAVAILGDPEVVILDEPTAGIDPVAKFQVWDAVASIRDAGKAIILASQDMDECEVLCSRLAVMASGQLQCIGTPQYLKSKLRGGFKVLIQLAFSAINSDDVCQIEDWNVNLSWKTQVEEFGKFMNERLPGCILEDEHVGLLEYFLPSAVDMTWSKVFAAMENATCAFQVEGFSVGQADLQQVFFKYSQARK